MTQVVLCSDHHTPVVGEHVRVVAGLCYDPSALASLPDGTRHLVIGLHRDDADQSMFQSSMRRVGLDPLGVGVVDLNGITDQRALTATLAGAVARTEAFPGATPEQAKLVPPRHVSRRGLLTSAAPLSIGAPSIDTKTCVADQGCRACVTSCPVDALTWDGGSVSYDKTTCVACGICVTTCPVGAVVNPTVTFQAIEAQVAAMIEAYGEPVGIRYHCRDAAPASGESGWLSVEVPCSGMLTTGWLLAPLTMGAAATDVLSCEDAACRLRNDDRVAAALADARRVLEAFGLGSERVDRQANGSLPTLPPPLPPNPTDGPVFGPDVEQRVIGLLASMFQTFSAAASLDSTPLGTVAIDPTTCTACSMCAQICPTDALHSTSTDDIVIDLDPRLCVACGQCLRICPEFERGAITMSMGFDLDDWAIGRREVRRDALPRCESCGRTIAPSAMLERITSLLGSEHSAVTQLLSTRCLDCRGR
jgi:ferredoxin